MNPRSRPATGSVASKASAQPSHVVVNKPEGLFDRFKHAGALRFLRGHFAQHLMSKEGGGLSFMEARSVAADAADDVFSEACSRTRVTMPKPGGAILDWIGKLDPAKIAAIIQMVMMILGMFAAHPAKLKEFKALLEKHAKAGDDDDDDWADEDDADTDEVKAKPK